MRKILPRRAKLPLLALVSCAALLRWFYLLEVSQAPNFTTPYPGLDAAMYGELAARIAGGDLLLEPYPYYYSALYAYFLALFQAIWGLDSWLAPLANVILGSVSVLFIFHYSHSFFHEKRIASITASVAACYGPFIVFDTSSLKTTLGLFLISASLLLLSHSRKPTGCIKWLIIGLLLGLAANLAPQLTLFILTLAALLLAGLGIPRIGHWFFPDLQRSFQKLFTLLGFLAGVLLAVLPFALRNHAVTGEWIFGNCTGGLHFYIGNHTRAWGGYSRLPGIRPNPAGHFFDAKKQAERQAGRPLSYSETERYWKQRTVKEIYSKPETFLKLLGKKLLLIISPYEIPNNENYQYLQERSRILPFLPGAGIVLPFCFAGWFFGMYTRRGPPLLHVYNICLFLALLFSLVTWRYSLPLLLGLLPFAGLLLSEMIQGFRKGNNLRWCFPVVLIFIFWVAGHLHPVAAEHGQDDLRRAEMKMSVSRQILELNKRLGNIPKTGSKERVITWLRITHTYERQGDIEGALRKVEAALKEAPQDKRLLRYRQSLLH